MAQSLNTDQRRFVNESARPMIERLVAFHSELAAYIDEAANQQTPITNDTEPLGDSTDGTTPRDDAPTLTGQHIAQLRTFCTNMKTQINDAALATLISLMVRDVRTVRREG